jgi:metallo-beta-lactamase class B
VKRTLALPSLLIVSGLILPRYAVGEDSARSAIDRLANALAKRSMEATFRPMKQPVDPFRVIGNIYYVGAKDVSSFLITTPHGHILLDTGFEDMVPSVRTSVEKLGFRFGDIKILLNSHAHLDHAGGHALVKRLTGAQIIMSGADAELLARGGRGDFLPVGDDVVAYEPARADRIVADQEKVTLGGVTLTAYMTPGHTRGCTTWTMTVIEGGRPLQVVFFGSTTLLPGVRLTGNTKYPAIADDYEKTFRVLKSLPCDVFLAPHGSMCGLDEKARRLAQGAKSNPFIDPDGYRRYIERAEKMFQELRRHGLRAAEAQAVPPT